MFRSGAALTQICYSPDTRALLRSAPPIALLGKLLRNHRDASGVQKRAATDAVLDLLHLHHWVEMLISPALSPQPAVLSTPPGRDTSYDGTTLTHPRHLGTAAL